MRRLKRLSKLKTINIIAAAVFLAMALTTGGLYLGIRFTANAVMSQRAAEYWGATEPYAQLSLFFAEEANFTFNSVTNLRNSYESKFIEDSITPPDSDNARLWVDAYSCETTISNIKSEGYAVNGAAAVAVGGDFFLFHPMEFISGGIFTSDGIMNDYIVIDDLMSWQLFGSNDVAGMTVTINEMPYIISGVVKRDNEGFKSALYGGSPRMYISYAAAEELKGELNITCYEVLLPEPITKYASNILEKYETTDKKLKIIVENSVRYRISSLYDNLSNIKMRSVRTNVVAFPYWENIAVVYEDSCAALLFAATITFAIAMVAVLYFAVILFIWTNKFFYNLKEKFKR